jgi:asparagine synthetase B (glutamine-hydrolysing)
MCGIAGVFGSRLAPGELERALERMASARRHRGPDQDNLLSFNRSFAALVTLQVWWNEFF